MIYCVVIVSVGTRAVQSISLLYLAPGYVMNVSRKFEAIPMTDA